MHKARYRLFIPIIGGAVVFSFLWVLSKSGEYSSSPSGGDYSSSQISPRSAADIRWRDVKPTEVFVIEEELIGKYPQLVRTDSRKNLYILDAADCQILQCAPNGKHLRIWGRCGRGPGEFQLPARLLIDKQDRLWVIEWRTGRLSLFSPLGDYLQTIQLPVAAPNVGILSDGNIIVSSLYRQPLWREYDQHGKLRGQFGQHLTASHIINQGRLVVGARDFLFFSYDFMSTILAYHRDGRLLFKIDGPIVVAPPRSSLHNPNYQLSGYEPFRTLDISTDAKRLYVLFSGLSPLQALAKSQEPTESNLIHVYANDVGEYLYSFRLPVLAKYIHVVWPYLYCTVYHPTVRVIKYQLHNHVTESVHR